LLGAKRTGRKKGSARETRIKPGKTQNIEGTNVKEDQKTIGNKKSGGGGIGED